MDENQQRIDAAFLAEKNKLISDNEWAQKAADANQFLKKYNLAFIYPYMQNFQISHLVTLEKEGRGDKETVFKIFAMRFFDLKSTTYFIESIFKRRPELNPFCHLIDQSVFMCLQRDYAGAISTLLPVIEGSLRHYLVNRRGMTHGRIMKTETQMSVFDFLKEDYLKGQRNWYEDQDGYRKYRGANIVFDKIQIDELVGYKAVFIDIWFDIIKDYLEKNVYLDTRVAKSPDGLSRHSIFHGFNGDIYYSLENYLKIFNCIVYLGWAFAMGNGGNLLFDLEDEDILDKWIAFEQIRVVSWTTTNIKAKVYAGYADFDAAEFSDNIFEDPLGKQFKAMPALSLAHRLDRVDKLIRKAVLGAKAKKK